ncbi:LapA family protein [Nocardiopsis algeriensis]|uniref:LapA family protein n=1 Tax=Nocardiopsis algeriensis TaxID=1478215 RepID=UPI003B4283B7
MDPLSMVLGAAIGFGGYLFGRLANRRQARALEQQRRQTQNQALGAAQNPQPLCGCGHHLVFHDQSTKKCQTQVVIPGRWTGQAGSSYRQCMCQGYRGPVPVDEYYAPDYLGGTDL